MKIIPYKERLAFCKAREIERSELGRLAERTELSSSQILRKCKNCNNSFIAKKADVKRGWGKFCSKSCKAEWGN